MAEQMDIRVLEFKTKYKNGKAEAWVLYGPAHNIKDCQTWERVSRLMPPKKQSKRDVQGGKMFHMRAIWSFIAPAYDAWKLGSEMPDHGTGLKSWAGVDAGQIAELVSAGIRTVEDLAGINDTLAEKVKLPGVHRLRSQAKEFLEGRGAAEMAADVADSKKELADTKEELAAAMDLMKEIQAELEANKAEKPKATKAKEAA